METGTVFDTQTSMGEATYFYLDISLHFSGNTTLKTGVSLKEPPSQTA